MANQVLLKKSSVASRVPTTSDLAYGEVALNYTDGKLYYKDSSNNIKYFLENSQVSSTLDDVTTNGSTTTNSITVGGLSIGSAYTLPTVDGTNNYVLSTDGSGNVSWASVGSLAGSGIQYTDLSVTTATAGTASLSYNNTNGVFTYTPPDLTSYITDITNENLEDLSNVNITSVANGEVLKYDSATSAWINSTDAGGIALTDLSVTTNSAGTAALSYNNTTGVFSYTPPDLSSHLQSSDIGSTVLAYDSNLQSFVTAFTLPTVDGSANQVLSTDGNGTLSFVNQSSGGTNYAYGVTVTTDTFTGDNTTVDFTLTRGASNDGYAIVSLNGVVQDPVDYSLSGTTLTFVTAPALNDNIDVRVISSGSAQQVNVNYTRFLYSITTTQSSISGADDNGNTLAYDTNSVEVYQNGIKLVSGDDFTATDGATITLTDSALNGDTIEVVSSGAAIPILTTNSIDENTATTTTTTANQVIDSWSATTYRTAKYILQAVNGSDVHSTEILLNHDETDVFITEYATVYSNASLFTVSAQLNGSTLELIATPANTNTTFDLVRTLLIARTAPTSSGDLAALSGSEDLASGSGSEDLN